MKLFFRLLCWPVLILFFLIPSVSAQHGDTKIVAGWVEKIVLADGQKRLAAKLDTGAKTSSIHAEQIELHESNGEKKVSFLLPEAHSIRSKKSIFVETPLIRTVLIKRHNLDSVQRPVVNLGFCLNGHYYETEFTLADRSNFLYPVLLGRSFLAENIVVDPGIKHKKSANLKKLECTPELAKTSSIRD